MRLVKPDQVWLTRDKQEPFLVLEADQQPAGHTRVRNMRTGLVVRINNLAWGFTRHFKYLGDLPVVGSEWVDPRTDELVRVTGVNGCAVNLNEEKGWSDVDWFLGQFKQVPTVKLRGYQIHSATGSKGPLNAKAPDRRFTVWLKVPKVPGETAEGALGRLQEIVTARACFTHYKSASIKLDAALDKYGPRPGETWSKAGRNVTVRHIKDGRVHHSQGSISLKRFVNEYRLGEAPHAPYSHFMISGFDHGNPLENWSKELDALLACKDPVVAARTKSRIKFARKRLKALRESSMTQPFGRMLRANTGKADCLVLDFASTPVGHGGTVAQLIKDGYLTPTGRNKQKLEDSWQRSAMGVALGGLHKVQTREKLEELARGYGGFQKQCPYPESVLAEMRSLPRQLQIKYWAQEVFEIDANAVEGDAPAKRKFAVAQIKELAAKL